MAKPGNKTKMNEGLGWPAGTFTVPAHKPPKLTFKEYLEFLTMANAFANHARKRFQQIRGDYFKL